VDAQGQAYLIWLLSPFTAFKDEDVVHATPAPGGESGDEIEPALRVEVVRHAEELRGIFGLESMERLAHESLEIVAATGARSHFAQLTGRFTHERLKALAQAEAILTKDRPEVLFGCVQNAGRSQMASALMHHLSVGEVSIRSAGSAPASEVNPAIVAVMSEPGVDLSMELPKSLADEVVRAADVVITMGCGDACPIYPGKRNEDWEIDDPSGQAPEQVRRIRDTIALRVGLLLAELGVPRRA
jgi:arsenate reductase (thioredoxin)